MGVRFGSKRTTGWRATIAVAMSNYIEAGSIIAIATSLSLWQERFGLDNLAVGLLASLSANAFGAAAGAAIGGPLCDRYGRKFIYTYDLLLYMVGVLLAVFATSYGMLLTAFVLTGIAVGAGVTASWTYIAEEAPPHQRAAHVGTAQLAWSIGPMIGYLLAVVVAPIGLLGSRLIFAHLFLVAAVTWWVRRGLPESEIWRSRNEVPGERPSFLSSLRGLFTKKANLTALLFLFGVYALWNTVAGQSGIFQPRVYEAAGVTSVTEQYLLQVLMWGCTSVATYLGFMLLADRMSRRWLYCSSAALGFLAWAALIYAPPSAFTMLFFAIGWGLSMGVGAQAFYGLWTSELFATRYRASAQGVLFLAARVLVGLLSVWFPVLLAQIGLKGLGLLILGLLAASLLIGTVWTPRTRGRSLQQIEEERYGATTTADEAVVTS
ncbi:inositol transporter-like SP family MFS transporter [Saccharopolyspora lacisalsi]|uniref:Inositol transporter-like SP family MFS transporter n=1 Tax=Halosaccharopolyspora lacisalsi TaxID=1000566 RepID=A0A839E316_9PSEU|nr:MFS transporter [Halosaccharopolyspora lacisalsi]MBA8826137.1 inositol transporter-like SP family MFS transporter [Halosaccharopolyspora lacisalsi]